MRCHMAQHAQLKVLESHSMNAWSLKMAETRLVVLNIVHICKTLIFWNPNYFAHDL